MADTTVSAQTARADGSVPYLIGQPNWQSRSVPDINDPTSNVTLLERQLIDVLILGDGFLSQTEFESSLQAWIDDFFKLAVYEVFKGAFRIRALYRSSAVRSGSARDSYYRVKMTDSGGVSGDGWYDNNTGDDLVFKQTLFADVDSFSDINKRRYPEGHSFNEGAIDVGDWLFGMYRNLVVCMLVKNSSNGNASGRAIKLYRPAPDDTKMVRVALGVDDIHEFSHAFAHLKDEYIGDGKREVESSNDDPARRSVLNLSNLSYSDAIDTVPWYHISPWGKEPRLASGDSASPLAGWLWVGGNRHLGVWHSEYQCLMNGSHDNFQYTQDNPEDDPTMQADGSIDGVSLRVKDRFCLWCQELVVMRIWERTSQMKETGQPSDFVERGEYWYERWVEQWRDNYWQLLDVPQQIMDREADYASQNPGAGGERLDSSDLYTPFVSVELDSSGPSEFDEGAWLLNLG